MRCPETQGWDVQVQVLTCLECPGTRYGHIDARDFARENFHCCCSAWFPYIAPKETCQSGGSLRYYRVSPNFGRIAD